MIKKWQPYKQFNFFSLLPKNVQEKLRKVLVFTEISGLKQQNQSPGPEENFRVPAPLSHKKARVPTEDSKESVYNIQYYTRDTRRAPREAEYAVHPSLGLEKPIELPRLEKTASLGNKNPAVLSYDPTGTRSAMTTTFAAMNALIAQNQPTHNVRMEWEGAEDEIIKDCEEKGIPVTFGRRSTWAVPTGVRNNTW